MISRKIIKEKVFSGGILSIVLTISYCCRMMSSAWLAFDSELYVPIFAIFMKAMGWLALFAGFLYVIRKKPRISFDIVPPIVFLFVSLIDSNKPFGGQSYLLIVISIVFFLLFDSKQKKKIITLFYYLVQVSIVFSEVIFISSILGLPLFKVENFYKESNAVYHRLLVFAVLNENSGSFRMCGFFNEPGALGTCCIFLFYIFKDKASLYGKVQLIIATILSFSLAGYILGFIVFGYLMIRKHKRLGIFILGSLVLLFFLIPKIDWGNDILNNFASRFEIDSGKLSGDNRTWWLFDEQVNEVFSNNSKYWGFGHDYDLAANSSYLRYFVLYGIFGTILIFVPWFFLAISKCKMDIHKLVFLLIFIVSLYQRPDPLISLYGYMIFFGGLELLKDSSVIKTKKRQPLSPTSKFLLSN